MNEHALKTAERPELLPWQAALMVVCVTAAGLFHEHPGAVRPLVATLQTVQLRSGVEHAAHPGDLIRTALRLGR